MVEIAVIIIFGILAQWIAWKMRIPAILPLILMGLALGPVSTLFTNDSLKLIEPVWQDETGLFKREVLFDFVSLAIAIILFEGGLTLKRSEIKNIGEVIVKLIILGSIITFFGAGLASRLIFGLPWSICFLFAALIVVTGPTVITPILRNLRLKKKISAILKWEGILIDPIGALIAVLVYEFITHVENDQAFTVQAVINFSKILVIGTSIGFSSAYSLAFMIRKNMIPHYLLNVVSLSKVLVVFVVSNLMAHESGLLSVVIMGMVMGNMRLSNIKDLLYFKESISVLLISILFIILAANINIEDILLIYNWKALILFLSVILVIRPLGVFLSTCKSNISAREKVFISWVGPRGIVAAGIASLFGERLVEAEVEGAEYITPLVFMIVLGTVLLNATTARLLAGLMRVLVVKPEGTMIIGCNALSKTIAQYLMSLNKEVIMVDNNPENTEKARKQGIETIDTDIFDNEGILQENTASIGYMLALTPNASVNKMAMEKFRTRSDHRNFFRLMCGQENDKTHLFSDLGDFSELSVLARKYHSIHEMSIENNTSLKIILKTFEGEKESLPIFVKMSDNKIMVIPQLDKSTTLTKGTFIAYLGKRITPLKIS